MRRSVTSVGVLGEVFLAITLAAGTAAAGPAIDASGRDREKAVLEGPVSAGLRRRPIRQLPPGAAGLPVGMTDYGIPGGGMFRSDTGLPAYPEVVMPVEVLEPLSASSFERYASRAVDPSGKTELRQFGYEHFLRAPSTFAPVADVPVGPDYLLGPGDEVVVSIWGRVERRDDSRVNREGGLPLPVIGVVPVSGVRFGRLRDLLRSYYDRHYVGYNLEVSLGKLRTIAVHVVGAARRPGTYELGSTATIFSALSAAAGPAKHGSMREVKLLRGGEVVSKLDLYGFFLTGNAPGDERLMSGDVVFVPRAGALVAVGGAVRSPGVYELAGEGAPLGEVMELAGGLAFAAAPSRVQIERVDDAERIVLESVDLSEEAARETRLRDGDIVRVESVPEKLEGVVYLQGNVARPGRRGYRRGMRVSDLLEGEEFGSAKYWSGRKLGVAAGGVVPPPGKAAPKPYWEFALVRRISLPDLEEVLIPFNLRKAVRGRDPLEDVELQPQDTVVIFAEREFKPARVVRSGGALEKPGVLPFSAGMTVRDLVAISGGLARDAYTKSAELTRTWLEGDKTRTERTEIDLAVALTSDGPSRANPALRPDDYLFVRRVRDVAESTTVTLAGEFRFPGAYSMRPGERLSEVIERAGGFTADAYLRGAVFLRESTRLVQQAQIDRVIVDLQAQNAAISEATGRAIGDPELAAAMGEAAARRRATIERLKQAKAQGRIVIRMREPGALKGTTDDLVLEHADRLTVPTVPSTVTVMGSVYASTAVVHRPGRNVAEYLGECGGTTPNADEKHIFVLRADGSVMSRKQRRLGGFVWREGENSWVVRDLLTAAPGPGDIVVVPEKLEPRIYPLKFAKDITQVLSQIAMTAGIIVAAF